MTMEVESDRRLLPWLLGGILSTGLLLHMLIRMQRDPNAGYSGGIDSAYCVIFREASILLPDSASPWIRLQKGEKTVFLFGHYHPIATEFIDSRHWFEVDSGMSEFAFDSSSFADIKMVAETISMIGDPAAGLKRGKVEAMRSDSGWVLKEWVSPDYLELRRRNYYRFLNRKKRVNDPFERLCVEEGPAVNRGAIAWDLRRSRGSP